MGQMTELKDWMGDLIDWSRQGRRSVKIETEPNTEVRAWCWDYDLMTGRFASLGQDAPTKEELIEKKRNCLERELNAL